MHYQVEIVRWVSFEKAFHKYNANERKMKFIFTDSILHVCIHVMMIDLEHACMQ